MEPKTKEALIRFLQNRTGLQTISIRSNKYGPEQMHVWLDDNNNPMAQDFYGQMRRVSALTIVDENVLAYMLPDNYVMDNLPHITDATYKIEQLIKSSKTPRRIDIAVILEELITNTKLQQSNPLNRILNK